MARTNKTEKMKKKEEKENINSKVNDLEQKEMKCK